MYRIGVVAPGGPLKPETPARVEAAAQRHFAGRAEIVFLPQCFSRANHFAGDDAERAGAFLAVANDPSFDALWFGRGGYGSGRIVDEVTARLEPAARDKAYLGYSDAGVLLAALHSRGVPRVAHGPMAQDVLREGGEAAVERALAWLVDGDAATLEPSVGTEGPTAAFNMAILSSIVGTPWQPDLGGYVLMLEEIAEYMYRVDRFLFHITSNPGIRQIAGLRLGRVSGVPENDPDFGFDEEIITRYWCEQAGISYLGRADIGHDAHNKVVPFG